MGARSREGIGDRLGCGIAGREDDLRDVLIEQLDLFHQLQRLMLLLRLAALLDVGANLARMPSIEGFLHRFGERPIPGIIHDHCGPCDRLQDRPMSADGQKQCRNQQPAAEAEQCFRHGGVLRVRKNCVKLSVADFLFNEEEPQKGA